VTTDNVKLLVERLAGKKPARGGLPAAANRPAIGDATGFAQPQPKVAASGSSGGGIASPLTEMDYAQREYHPDEIITTTDGIFSASIRRVKRIILTDANLRTVDVLLGKP
jgi:hypothetical protein